MIRSPTVSQAPTSEDVVRKVGSLAVGTKTTSRIRSRLRPLPTNPTVGAADVKRSARLRNKKVEYQAMLTGSWQGEALPPGSKPRPSSQHARSATAGRNTVWVEVELKALISKQKRKRLNAKEKRRLKRLRERLGKPNVDTPKKTNARRIKARREKLRLQAKLKLELARKCSQEHCYAAVGNAAVDSATGQQGAEVAMVTGKDTVQTECAETVCEQIATVSEQTETVCSQTASVVVGGEACPTPSLVTETSADTQASTTVTEDVSPPLQVVHRDSIQRNGQRGRCQGGDLHLHLFKALDSPCVQCSTCLEKMSVRKFLKHLHHHSHRDELMDVSLPQRLELRDMPTPSEHLETMWQEFEKRQKKFMEEQRKPTRRKRTSKVKAKKNGRLTSPRKVATTETAGTPRLQPRRQEANNAAKSTRHSSRIRKQKQLHPMEKYVYTENKRPRLCEDGVIDVGIAVPTDTDWLRQDAEVQMEIEAETDSLPLVEDSVTVVT